LAEQVIPGAPLSTPRPSDWEGRLVQQRSEVRLLFDENLPPSLKSHLSDLFPGSVHVRDGDVNLAHAPDSEIWEHARAFNFAIVTKDSDFATRARLEGSPPTVIQIRAGNCSVSRLVTLIRENAAKITTEVQFGGSLLEIRSVLEASAVQASEPAE
jgi:predicted nuclease of predicted toxin-antitoxin system